MKKLCSIFTVVVLNLSVYATSMEFLTNSCSPKNLSENLIIKSLSELSDNVLNEIMQGNYPNIAIEFSQGTLLPIYFFLKGDLANLIEKEINLGQIEIQKTFYVRSIGEKLIFSSDLSEWKSFLEFITGNTSVGLNIYNGEASIIFGAEANQRI